MHAEWTARALQPSAFYLPQAGTTPVSALVTVATAPDTLTTYARHPLYDDFWRERSVKARWKNLDIPVLEITGW
ncbi:CocE/NonD family hydrolase [Nonomuraea bangladeshensis]|uniref:CocE/NonD family hydrolase n=1 Tax=Nonomuraea bangladeshensis TaxID=404385 RepID=UPI0031D8E0C5